MVKGITGCGLHVQSCIRLFFLNVQSNRAGCFKKKHVFIYFVDSKIFSIGKVTHISNVYRQVLHTNILNGKEASKWLQSTWAQSSFFSFSKGQSKLLLSYSTTKRSI